MLMKQKMSYTLFYKQCFLVQTQYMLIIFSVLYYAYNMLEIVESTLKQVHERSFDAQIFCTFTVRHLHKRCKTFAIFLVSTYYLFIISFINSLFVFCLIWNFQSFLAHAYCCNQGNLINFACINFHRIYGIPEKKNGQGRQVFYFPA